MKQRKLSVVMVWLALTAMGMAQDVRAVLHVGVSNNPPLVAMKGDQAEGMAVDVIEAIAKREGWTLRYVPGTWQECLDRLANGEIDLLLDMAKTPEREASYAFTSTSIFVNWGELCVPRGAPVRVFTDLGGRRIGVMKGGVYAGQWQQLVEQFSLDCEIVELANYPAVFAALTAGEVDAAVVSRLYAGMHREAAELRLCAVLMPPVELYLVASKQVARPVLLAINRHLGEMKADEGSVYYAAMSRWFAGVTVSSTPIWVKRLTIGLGLSVGLLLLCAVYSRWRIHCGIRSLASANRQLASANEALQMGYACGEIVVAAPGSDLLVSAVCAQCVMLGRYKGALVVRSADGGSTEFAVVAAYFPDGIGGLRPVEGQGAWPEVAAAVADNHVRWRPLAELADEAAPGQAVAKALGALSVVSLALTDNETNHGVLILYSRREQAPPEAELAMLSSLARDVGIGLARLKLREQHQKAIDELATSNRQLAEALENLKRSQDQIAQQERLRALGQLASGIAHDFNNSLSVIRGFADLILLKGPQAVPPEKLERYIRLIQTSASDAGETVSRLREFYRSREKDEPTENVDLAALAAETAELTSPRWKDEARARGGEIRIRQELRAVAPVAGNPAELRECLTNLILNAVDAMPGGGTITLRTHQEAGQVHLEVADTGQGMDEATRLRCIEPFFSTKGANGTGLGLSMVHGIVERHEGTLTIESELGKGTSIRLVFPVTGQVSQDWATATRSGHEPLSGRVLVAEDETSVRELLVECLTGEGLEVIAAVDGREALTRFRESRFDLVITDLAMPEMGGQELVTAIRAMTADVPIVMLTGFGGFMEAANEHPEGVNRLLPKPVVLPTLNLAIRELLADRRPG